MALYEVVKPAKIVVDGKVSILCNVGAYVDLTVAQKDAYGDAVRPVGTADEPAAAEQTETSGEESGPVHEAGGPQPQGDQPPASDAPVELPTEQTSEARRRRGRNEGSDAS